MKKNLAISFICLGLIAAAVVLGLVIGPKFDSEFAGSTAVTATLGRDATNEDLSKACSAVGNVISARILEGKRVMVKTSAKADAAALAKSVAAALGVEESAVSAAVTDKTITKSGLSSAMLSLIIAGAVVVVWYAIRFGIIPAIDTLFGFIVVAAVWFLPYLFFTMDYTALFVYGVGAVVYALLVSLVFEKRIKKSTDVNVSRALPAALTVTAAGLVFCVALGVFSGIWGLAVPLAVTLIGACFAAVCGAPACITVFKK